MDCLHFIGGEYCKSQSGKTFTNVNPATGLPIGTVALGDAHDIEAAVRAAERALKSWSQMSMHERSGKLQRLGQLIAEHRAELAHWESLDTGKPLSECLNGDIPRAELNFSFYSSLAEHQHASQYEDQFGHVHTTSRVPLGIVGLITPWNLPLYLATWKLAPALLQGNAVILKPAELTPLTVTRLASLSTEAGIPPGVFNIVHGFGGQSAGEALVKHPKVKAISFTGETTTGVAIMESAAKTLKKLSFELGGKGASVVMADADLKHAAKRVVFAAFRNQGQVCLAGSRLLIHESVKSEFIQLVKAEMATIKIGDPLDESTSFGSLISREHQQKVLSYLDHAKNQKLKISVGGDIPKGFESGAYVSPTLIEDVPQDDRLIQEEVFGPVLTVQTFKDLGEALDKVNGTPYGLSCSIYTSNLDTAHRFARHVQMGMVWINDWFLRELHTAFGGMKRSGIGREGGQFSLDFFSEFKTVSFRKPLHGSLS
jgi:aminomuconate-semialdehyde/2-hydroxymuconate-6-semialdehyde dehydrogenase